MLFLPDMADVMPHTFTPKYKDESCFALAARGLLRLFTLRCGILRNADILDDEADFAPRRAAGCGGACPRAAWHRWRATRVWQRRGRAPQWYEELRRAGAENDRRSGNQHGQK